MRPNNKFIRVVLGAMVGSALWAGCATERQVAYEPAGASVSNERECVSVIDPRSDQTAWHVDTSLERRTGWQLAFYHPPYLCPTAASPVAIANPVNYTPQIR